LRWPKLTAGEKWMHDLDAAKLEKLIRRGYLETGRVHLTIPRFLLDPIRNWTRISQLSAS
jgi:hypothetical protein